MDFLQHKTQDLERKLRDATILKEEAEGQLSCYKNRNSLLSSRNRGLEIELKDADRKAKIIISDKNMFVEKADRHILESEV